MKTVVRAIIIWIVSCFRFAENTPVREKQMRWALLSSCVMFHDVTTLAHLMQSPNKASARAGRPLDRPARGSPTPRETAVARRTSRA